MAGSMLATGCVQSQFESQISNGKVDSAPGGKRDQWENRLFGQAYQDAAPFWRPKYGALFLLGQSDGPAPRFGSCYFLLSPDATKRATFCYGDSHLDPPIRGTYELWEDVLSELFQESFTRDGTLGLHGLRPPALVGRMLELLQAPLSDKQLATALSFGIVLFCPERILLTTGRGSQHNLGGAIQQRGTWITTSKRKCTARLNWGGMLTPWLRTHRLKVPRSVHSCRA